MDVLPRIPSAAAFLVPTSIEEVLDFSELLIIRERIQRAIEDGNPFCYLDPNHDWEAAKQRVEEVLNECGESLDSLRE